MPKFIALWFILLCSAWGLLRSVWPGHKLLSGQFTQPTWLHGDYAWLHVGNIPLTGWFCAAAALSLILTIFFLSK